MKTTREELGARVRITITDHLKRFMRSDTEVTDTSALVDGLKLDSLDLVDLTMEFEDAFDLELDDEQVAELVTVGDLINHLAEKLGLVEAAA